MFTFIQTLCHLTSQLPPKILVKKVLEPQMGRIPEAVLLWLSNLNG